MLVPVEARGSILKTAHCEQCGTHYRYEVTRKTASDHVGPLAIANKAAQARAQTIANQKLGRALEHAEELVACPECGWVQSRMIRAKRLKLIKIAVLVAFLTPWPTSALVAMYFKDKRASTSKSELLTILGAVTALEVALIFVAAMALIALARPNKGVFFPFSKRFVDSGQTI